MDKELRIYRESFCGALEFSALVNITFSIWKMIKASSARKNGGDPVLVEIYDSDSDSDDWEANDVLDNADIKSNLSELRKYMLAQDGCDENLSFFH
uniref:Uncharacterized protein n=1 Tax=Romanomermis culicivorax TaxID=13658 RepID=A0A915LBQ8_ROMCU